MPVLAVELKEIIESAICESRVDFGAVQRNIAIGKFHTDMLAGVVVIVKLHVNSGTGETAAEFIPRLTAVYGSGNLCLEHRLFLFVFLLER